MVKYGAIRQSDQNNFFLAYGAYLSALIIISLYCVVLIECKVQLSTHEIIIVKTLLLVGHAR